MIGRRNWSFRLRIRSPAELPPKTGPDCEVRFLSKTLKMGTHTVTETLNEFRRMGLVKFISSKGRGKKRFIEQINVGQ
jgi:hypothetical protein